MPHEVGHFYFRREAKRSLSRNDENKNAGERSEQAFID
jgi:hypothetical protein